MVSNVLAMVEARHHTLRTIRCLQHFDQEPMLGVRDAVSAEAVFRSPRDDGEDGGRAA